MTTRPRLRRDLSWPVPATDLQDLDVLEILRSDDGQVLWRVDEQPAATPQECREALLKRRHPDEPEPDPGGAQLVDTIPITQVPLPALLVPTVHVPESTDVLELIPVASLRETTVVAEPAQAPTATDEPVDLPLRDEPAGALLLNAVRDVAEVPELAAVLALTDMPDVPMMLDATEFLDGPATEPLRPHADVIEEPVPPPVETPQDTPQAVMLPQVSQAPEVPAIAALSAIETADVSPALPPPDVLDMATAMQWREDFESLDAPVLHVIQAPADTPGSHVPHAVPERARRSRFAELLEAADALPGLIASHASPSTPRAEAETPAERSASALVREWPQAVEFVDNAALVESGEPVSLPAMANLVESQLGPDEPVADTPDLPAVDERPAVTAPASWSTVPARWPEWVAAAREALDRSRVAPAERLALVGGGMLMGLLFAIVGGPRGPVTPEAATPSTVAHLSGPATVGPVTAGSIATPQRLVPAGHTANANVPAFPVTIAAMGVEAPGAKAAGTYAGRRDLSAQPSAVRPQAAPAVVGAIQRYAAAYNRQDARATAAVWPTADRQTLVKTFNALREQRLTLSSCTTAVTGDSATASCVGTRRYRPRVGDSSTRVQQGRWRFGLKRSAGAWLIASVTGP